MLPLIRLNNNSNPCSCNNLSDFPWFRVYKVSKWLKISKDSPQDSKYLKMGRIPPSSNKTNLITTCNQSKWIKWSISNSFKDFNKITRSCSSLRVWGRICLWFSSKLNNCIISNKCKWCLCILPMWGFLLDNRVKIYNKCSSRCNKQRVCRACSTLSISRRVWIEWMGNRCKECLGVCLGVCLKECHKECRSCLTTIRRFSLN